MSGPYGLLPTGWVSKPAVQWLTSNQRPRPEREPGSAHGYRETCSEITG